MPARLWIDVEDLFEYARVNKRPSGIQRLAFEIYRVMHARSGDSVQFVRHDVPNNSFRAVPWHDVADLFNRLTEPTPSLPPDFAVYKPRHRFFGKLLHRFSPSLRPMVISAVLAQGTALRAWKRVFVALGHSVKNRFHRRKPTEVRDTTALDFASVSARGDVLLVLGAPWHHPDYGALIQAQRRRGLRFAVLIYDMIPIRRPEWSDAGLVRVFRRWMDSLLPQCDVIFAISRHTASDIQRYARENAIHLPRVIPIPIGTGFTFQSKSSDWNDYGLPLAGTYALYVSTMEPRKNHMLLFRVWRKLIEDLPDDDVPMLVFAGRIGWMVNDLVQQIRNTDCLDGKLQMIEDVTDAELADLYRGCQFTLFPSLYEGWGLPVTESMAFGKPCIIAASTSLPEAGGTLVRSFDPDNLHDAYRVIKETITDPFGLARWETRVRREFRPAPWSATVDAILAGLDEERR